jgi:hypothetical protein
MKKKLFILLVMSVGIAYATKIIKELAIDLDGDPFDIGEE